jgi:enoyl-[acyl-carrier protein] reductase I
MNGLGLEGKNVVVLGVADESSIAWAISQAFASSGAHVWIGYQQKFFSRVRLLLRDHPDIQAGRCDVLNDQEMSGFFDRFRESPIDVLVHAIAFGPPELFTEYPSNVSLEGFCQAMNVSVYSLCKVVRHAKPLLCDWASVMTLTFQASQRAERSYGMMGVAKSALESMVRYLALELGGQKIRVNAISPGPIETVASLGILMAFLEDRSAVDRQQDHMFQSAIDQARREMDDAASDELALARLAWKHFQTTFTKKCAIEETVSKEDVAGCALFLGSDMSRKITGQVIHVDCGLSSSLIL